MQIVDSYSESNQDQDYALAYYIKRVGQSFTGDGGTLNSAKFYIKKIGSPTGTATVRVYAHTGTFGSSSTPTGSPLAESASMNLSDANTSLTLEEFIFSGIEKITLEDGTNYCVSLEYNNDGFVNSSNRWQIGVDGSSPTHDGNSYTYVSSYDSQATDDLIFYVYKDDNLISPFPCFKQI